MVTGHPQLFQSFEVKTFVRTVSFHLALFLGHQIIFVGCVVPHPANDEKRHRLYIKFWKTLKDLNLWNDEEITAARKEERTVRDDKRDIIPNRIITVYFFFILSTSHHIYTYIMYMLFMQEIHRRHPSVDGNYRDYKLTFDAEDLA